MYDHQPIAREDIGQLLVQPVPAESVAPGCPSTSLSGLCVISGLLGARSAPIPAAEGRNPLGPGPDPYRGSGRTPTERARPYGPLVTATTTTTTPVTTDDDHEYHDHGDNQDSRDDKPSATHVTDPFAFAA